MPRKGGDSPPRGENPSTEMKRAQDITTSNLEEERLKEFDLREIDAANQRSHFSLKYTGRLEAALRAVRRSAPPGSLVLEVGCSQANAGLLLAEEGYRVIALDILKDALGYALKKRKRGEFHAVCGSAEALPIKERSCEVIYFGELIEHCADPAGILRSVARCLKDDGALIVTTMNGAWFGSPDPTYSQAASEEVAHRQFGRGGEDHLFAFTAPELIAVIEQAGLEVQSTELHATVLHSDRLMPLKRVVSPALIRTFSRFICKLPLIGRLTALTLLVVASRAATSDL
jgi:2-polyprenyl-3-methyl-5-hydroxy-6-metoxy-1,4-benzoquinol methylase